MDKTALTSSFRDPSGSLFLRGGVLLRQVNTCYAADYDRLMASGLYDALVGEDLLIRHEEAPRDDALSETAHKVLRPERVPFISYPYEWCFDQLKDAALTTLAVQKRSLECGMILKDASAYNIQFVNGAPVLIDTLSFETYREGEPWVAYRQFCQHFLAPLALMSYKDARLGQLLRVHIDGIPLDLASELLPFRTRCDGALAVHLHLHARCQDRYADTAVKERGGKVSRMALRGLIDSLESAVTRMVWRGPKTVWTGYYGETSYSEQALAHKDETVASFLESVGPKMAWDLGANTGRFSRIASGKGLLTVSFDADHGCVRENYRDARGRRETRILPLMTDLTNPSPAIGWALEERMSLIERGPADTILALALIHHLAIANNVPLDAIAAFFAALGRSAIVEFIPKEDPQVRRLLMNRDDIFPGYTREGFERAFGRVFTIKENAPVKDTGRTLYLMLKKQ